MLNSPKKSKPANPQVPHPQPPKKQNPSPILCSLSLLKNLLCGPRHTLYPLVTGVINIVFKKFPDGCCRGLVIIKKPTRASRATTLASNSGMSVGLNLQPDDCLQVFLASLSIGHKTLLDTYGTTFNTIHNLKLRIF